MVGSARGYFKNNFPANKATQTDGKLVDGDTKAIPLVLSHVVHLVDLMSTQFPLYFTYIRESERWRLKCRVKCQHFSSNDKALIEFFFFINSI